MIKEVFTTLNDLTFENMLESERGRVIALRDKYGWDKKCLYILDADNCALGFVFFPEEADDEEYRKCWANRDANLGFTLNRVKRVGDWLCISKQTRIDLSKCSAYNLDDNIMRFVVDGTFFDITLSGDEIDGVLEILSEVLHG